MMPPAAAYLAAFGAALRRNGLPATSDQTTLFPASLSLLGPGGIADVREAALACFGPPSARRSEFDALFRAHSYGDAPEVGAAEADSGRAVRPARH